MQIFLTLVPWKGSRAFPFISQCPNDSEWEGFFFQLAEASHDNLGCFAFDESRWRQLQLTNDHDSDLFVVITTLIAIITSFHLINHQFLLCDLINYIIWRHYTLMITYITYIYHICHIYHIYQIYHIYHICQIFHTYIYIWL